MSDWAELSRLDASDQAALCARGDVTAHELWEACQARIAALNPLLRAVVCLAERVEPRPGPLSGVPFLLKDASPPVGQDALLLALAYQLERARPWQHRWPPYSFPVLFGAD